MIEMKIESKKKLFRDYSKLQKHQWDYCGILRIGVLKKLE
jgi:hypothetical protein